MSACSHTIILEDEDVSGDCPRKDCWPSPAGRCMVLFFWGWPCAGFLLFTFADCAAPPVLCLNTPHVQSRLHLTALASLSRVLEHAPRILSHSHPQFAAHHGQCIH
ncbi:hypothetical protein EXIGLDRAFT_136372 [Exidia glandulosa HHB12029]|uniref:Uncharacterized protein n=1 Tax=Exidia glandulosa HHB12029 TaxID=1314781 RepID=A0A165G229_EXIGL|nr:hypothetical protein EXIGLDRAFT_136372 [Exidia glandulosa HHB12029]